MDELNFSYGVIGIVGVLAAVSIGFIVMDPTDVIEPRVVVEENLVACTMQWDPMCGVDGKTYGNMCGLDAANAKLDYPGECIDTETISVTSYILPKTAYVGETLLVEVEFRDDDKNIVDHVNYDISATQNAESILSEPGSHRHPGMHSIHETTILDESSVEIMVIIQGLGHGEDITEPIGVTSSISVIPKPTPVPTPESTPEPTPEPVQEPTPEPVQEPTPEPVQEPTPEPLPMTAIVSVPIGSAVPGCNDTNECYLPYEINVAIGATVSWINDDSAAHTVTSGAVGAVSSVFDSSLLMAGDVYEFTFDEAGSYDYFCIVHPWMTGIVNVQ